MIDLVWIIPLSLGGAVLLYRLVRAPYEIHLALERQVRQEANQNRGVILKCSKLDFLKGQDDLTMIASVQSLVNGNTYPITISVSLVIPVAAGGITVNFSTAASAHHDPDIKTPLPLLPPLIALPPKEGVGPGYWLFRVTHEYLTGFLSPFPKASMDEMSTKVQESELYFEIKDLANDDQPQRFDAPGTLGKRGG